MITNKQGFLKELFEVLDKCHSSCSNKDIFSNDICTHIEEIREFAKDNSCAAIDKEILKRTLDIWPNVQGGLRIFHVPANSCGIFFNSLKTFRDKYTEKELEKMDPIVPKLSICSLSSLSLDDDDESQPLSLSRNKLEIKK